MKITLNGRPQEYAEALNLKNLVEQFYQERRKIIIEINGKIIKNPQWQDTLIREGDRIELITLVGGG